jgi:hypothetical protein
VVKAIVARAGGRVDFGTGERLGGELLLWGASAAQSFCVSRLNLSNEAAKQRNQHQDHGLKSVAYTTDARGSPRDIGISLL